MYKRQFSRFDEDMSGDIDLMELKKMMENMGQAKTHLQLKRMIKQVDTTNSGTINYRFDAMKGCGFKVRVLQVCLPAEYRNRCVFRPISETRERQNF